MTYFQTRQSPGLAPWTPRASCPRASGQWRPPSRRTHCDQLHTSHQHYFSRSNDITESLGESLLLLGGVYLHQSGAIPQPSAELTGGAPAVLLVVQFPVVQQQTPWRTHLFLDAFLVSIYPYRTLRHPPIYQDTQRKHLKG